MILFSSFYRIVLIVIFTLLVGITPIAYGSTLENLAREGYAVIDETQVEDEFEGCDYDKKYLLDNGLIFVCSEYNYSYSYRPEVFILVHIRSGDIKIIIDDEEYEGTIYHQ